jgi:tetratricopeptide (TPR) repeat protein
MIKQQVYSPTRFKEAKEYLQSTTSITYLKAKYYLVRNKLEKANQFHNEVICSKEHDYHYMHLNIIAAAYLDLSSISYKENKFQLALEYAEKGIKAFYQRGKRKYIGDSLIYNKSLFLQKLGRLRESEETLDEVWNKRSRIESATTRAKVYKLKATLKKYRHRYNEAKNILEKGIEIAVSNSLIDIGFELWVELGDIAYAMELFDLSEKSYQTALQLRTEPASVSQSAI